MIMALAVAAITFVSPPAEAKYGAEAKHRAEAGSGSGWTDHQGMLSTRLVLASKDHSSAEGTLVAWEAKLAPGWKTYWRSPGEAGLPVNVFIDEKKVDLMYPMPGRFSVLGIETFGYAHQVMMPFYVPVTEAGVVKIEADFMVCKDICVPFRHSYELNTVDLAPASSVHDFRIETWLEKVPARAGDGGAGLEITAVKVTGKAGHQKLVVDVRADRTLSKADMLVEVGETFHFEAPRIQLLGDGKTARLILSDRMGASSHDLRGKTVRLTFSDGRGAAIDRSFDLSK